MLLPFMLFLIANANIRSNTKIVELYQGNES